jgi:uncharacterized membrane protein affecting hemolysin expression
MLLILLFMSLIGMCVVRVYRIARFERKETKNLILKAKRYEQEKKAKESKASN